jgi:hypothetical protein
MRASRGPRRKAVPIVEPLEGRAPLAAHATGMIYIVARADATRGTPPNIFGPMRCSPTRPTVQSPTRPRIRGP